MLMQLRIWMNCQYSLTIYGWVVCAKIHHVNNCIQLSTLRWTTISNTVICTLHNFVSSRKLDLFIRALLQDHILALKKLRVRLTYILFYYKAICRAILFIKKIYLWQWVPLYHHGRYYNSTIISSQKTFDVNS